MARYLNGEYLNFCVLGSGGNYIFTIRIIFIYSVYDVSNKDNKVNQSLPQNTHHEENHVFLSLRVLLKYISRF